MYIPMNFDKLYALVLNDPAGYTGNPGCKLGIRVSFC
jgi:hypothetical protein